jgi:hypothetical protein
MNTLPNDDSWQPESLSRLKDAIQESKSGQRQDLFAARDALSALATEIEVGPNEPLGQIVEVIQKILGSLLRGSSFGEDSSVLDLAEMLANYLGSAIAIPQDDPWGIPSMSAGSAVKLSLGEPGASGFIQRLVDTSHTEPFEGEDSLKLINDSRLGMTLVRLGMIDAETLDKALVLQGVGCKRLGEVLLGMGALTDEALEEGLAEQRAVTLRLADGLNAGKLQMDKTAFRRRP